LIFPAPKMILFAVANSKDDMAITNQSLWDKYCCT
jgi:hypothetical protein